MEVLFYSFALAELKKKIVFQRIQKIYCPAPRLWSFDLGRAGYLIAHLSPSSFYFYLSKVKPDNPSTPPAQVMWLRKRLCGRKITGLVSVWPRRSLVFSLSGGDGLLVLDSKNGPGIQSEIVAPPSLPPWPDLSLLLSSTEKFPYISKAFRAHLAKLEESARIDFYQQAQAGSISTFWFEPGSKSPLCWPISEAARPFSSALQAAEACFARSAQEKSLLTEEVDKVLARKKKRLQRNLAKLDEDEKRLRGLVDLQHKGNLLKSVLYLYPSEMKKKEIEVDHGQGVQRLSLNPRLTLRENMDFFFQRGKKGRRGLEFMEKRRAGLRAELSQLESGSRPFFPVEDKQKSKRRKRVGCKYANLAVYRLPAGWIVLRGKDAKANHSLLSQAASSFDLWFHAAGGPGAHIVLKRDFPDQEVDQASLEQAASLAAAYSWQKQAARAEVLCALVKYVRKNKGAGLGQVVMDRIWKSLHVPVRQEEIEQYRLPS